MSSITNDILKNLLSGKVPVSDTHPIRFLSASQVSARITDCVRYATYARQSSNLKIRESGIAVYHALPRLG